MGEEKKIVKCVKGTSPALATSFFILIHWCPILTPSPLSAGTSFFSFFSLFFFFLYRITYLSPTLKASMFFGQSASVCLSDHSQSHCQHYLTISVEERSALLHPYLMYPLVFTLLVTLFIIISSFISRWGPAMQICLLISLTGKCPET